MLKIDKEFKGLIPSPSTEEFIQLEKNILLEGIREPIILWENIIIDGHHRYEIACKHNLEYKTDIKYFENRELVIDWMINNQLGRRNLSLFTQSYLRGLQYSREKNKHGGDRKSEESKAQNEPLPTTAEKLATQHNVSRETIKRDAEYSKAVDTITTNTSPEIKEKILNRVIDISKKETEHISKLEPIKQKQIFDTAIEKNIPIREISIDKPHVAFNSGENEWYTPFKYINSAREVMGSIELDPASSEIANKTVNADKIYTIDDNGLNKQWEGNVWLNPPYSSDLIGKFTNKLSISYKDGNINQAVVMVNNATETQWFNTIIDVASAVVFPKSRIKFIDVNGKEGNTPLQGQCFIYIGDNKEKFLEIFKIYGWGATL